MLVLVGPGGKEVRLGSQVGEGLKVKKKVRVFVFFFLRSLSGNDGLLVGALTARWNRAKRMP